MNISKIIKFSRQDEIAIILKKWRRSQDKMTLKVLQSKIKQQTDIDITLGYLSRIETVGAIKPSVEVFKACLKVYDKNKVDFVIEAKNIIEKEMLDNNIQVDGLRYLHQEVKEEKDISLVSFWLWLEYWSKGTSSSQSQDFLGEIYEQQVLQVFRKLSLEDKENIVNALDQINQRN